MTKVFDKTEKGREEISTRKYHLAPRLRSLLVMIDGKQAADELLKKVAGIGLTAQSMADLLEQGFIQESTSVAAASVADPANDPETTPAGPVQAQPALVLLAKPAVPATVLPEGQTQFESIYRFYNETIKSTIGLRGYGLQLKVEKAASINDFRLLRKPYLEAVLKAQGREMARSLRDRLDSLLYLGEPSPEFEAINGLGD